jgi:hypothetical protein
MSDKPKRRWYQFSLKSLMIAITAGSLALGCWFGWLRNYRECLRLAEAHEKAAAGYDKCYDHWIRKTPTGKPDRLLMVWSQQADECRQLSNAYHRAAWQPWLRLSMRPLFSPESPQPSP